jgi:hypothetical protein
MIGHIDKFGSKAYLVIVRIVDGGRIVTKEGNINN